MVVGSLLSHPMDNLLSEKDVEAKMKSYQSVTLYQFKLILQLKSPMMELEQMFTLIKNFKIPSIFFSNSHVMDNLILDLTPLLVKKCSGERFTMSRSSMKHSMLNLLKKC